MESFTQKDGLSYVQFKSKLEFIAFKYADMNPKISKFSVEPFNIQYVKPTDNKVHRYFIDMFLEFVTGDKFLVEVKSKSETYQPQKPKCLNPKTIIRYKEAIETYVINKAKWKAAEDFAKQRGMQFIILTEEQLK